MSFFCLFYTLIITSYCLFRIGIAVTISLYTYRYLVHKKYKKAFLTIIIACGFHLSATILFPIWILYIIFNSKRISFNCFITFFCLIILLGFLFVIFVPSLFAIFGLRYVSYKSNGIAINTYLSTFVFICLIIYKKKDFFKNNVDVNCFITLLCTFLIMDLQIVATIFYRMIYFIYPCIMIIIPRLYKIYRVKKSETIIPVFVRSFLLFYLFYFLYKFCSEGWISYGLNHYGLFYFY